MYLNEARQLLAKCYDEARSYVSLCFISPPGVGKTQMVEEFARERGVNLVKILCSQMLPSEVAGINVPDGDDFKPLDPWLLKSLKDGDILFFDEWLTAPDMVRNACLTLVKDRELMSNRKLPDVMIVGATNPIATVSQLTPQQRDRFIWVDIEYSHVEYGQYIGKTFHGEGAEQFASDCHFDSSSAIAKKYNVWSPRAAERWIRWILADGGAESHYWDKWKELLSLSYSSTEPYRALTTYIEAPAKARREAEKRQAEQERRARTAASEELRKELVETPTDILNKAVAETLMKTATGFESDEGTITGAELISKYGDDLYEANELQELFADEDFIREVLEHVEKIAAS